MTEDGQIYFAPENEIPQMDKDRLEEHIKKLNAELEKSGSNFVSAGYISQMFKELKSNQAGGSIVTRPLYE
jgi:hypothetical protein